jgi:hypothetical protein
VKFQNISGTYAATWWQKLVADAFLITAESVRIFYHHQSCLDGNTVIGLILAQNGKAIL